MTKAKAANKNLEQSLIKKRKEKAQKKMSPGAMDALEKSKEISKIDAAKVAAAENHYDCGAFVRLPSNRGK